MIDLPSRLKVETDEPPSYTAWVASALDAIAELNLAFQSTTVRGAQVEQILGVAAPVLRRVGDLTTVAFVIVDDDGLSFAVEGVDPADMRSTIEAEVRHQVEQGTFGWALYRSHGMLVQGGPAGPWVLLHVLATPERVLGMFVATPRDRDPFLPDAAEKAISIVLGQCAGVIETGRLQRELEDYNRRLEKTVAERTEKLRLSEEEARAASRAKSAFLANMSHEIRTPINGIMGLTSLLLESSLDAEQRRHAEAVDRSAEALLSIVNDILDISKVEAGKLTLDRAPFDLRHDVEEVLELLAPQAASKGVELVLRYHRDAPRHVVGDAVRVRQVVMNLVGNAVRFTPSGHVLVDVQPHPCGFRLDVADTGIGIDSSIIEQLFEKFTQADTSGTRKVGGTGLGLAIARSLARLMAGDVTARSSLGEGATFTFHASVDILERRSRDEAASASAIVVSPHDLVLSTTADTIQALGHDVRRVRRVSEIRDVLMNGGPSIDVVLIDAGCGEADLRDAIGLTPEGVSPAFHALLSAAEVTMVASLRAAGYSGWVTKPAREARLADLFATARKPAAPPSAEASHAALSGLRILVADDDAVNRMLATAVLERMGAVVTNVTNGREAVEAYARSSFDLVLMDCQMPDMDGYEATRAIRGSGRRSDTPIIAVTASAMAGDRERALDAGMCDYVTKPFKAAALRETILRWIAPGSPPRSIPSLIGEAAR